VADLAGGLLSGLGNVEWTAKTVQLGQTHFRIEKLPAMAAFDVLEQIRVALGGVWPDVDLDSGVGSGMLGAILRIPKDELAQIRAALFRAVFFRSPKVRGQEATLAGMEDMAFEGLEPVSVYRVLIGAVAVNFRDSFAGSL